ncbi:MAG: hypothetical protein ABIS50_17230 [Luteolibacter sp.]|uniref:hypothetical protein n=1 Tax=Luteolibacter sp. TaxID=1962973 RepID=UPI003267A6C7
MKPPSFKLWIKIGALVPLLFICIFVGFVFPDSTVSKGLSFVASAILIPLCLMGGIMGVLLSMNRLFFRCPFCSAKSRAIGGGGRCLWIECPTCGVISGTFSRFPPLTWRIEKETDQGGDGEAGEDV